MAMATIHSNDVKIYDLGAAGNIQTILSREKLRSDKSAGETAQFIQDFDFPTSSSKIAISADKQYIVAAGLYKPTLKIFETAHLALKCARGLNSEVVDLCLLGDDYKKIAMATVDRNVEFHAQYGRHFRTRVLRQPRCLAFAPFAAELFVGCSGTELYRLRLDVGRFAEPLSLPGNGVDCLLLNPQLELLIAGCAEAGAQLLDVRASDAVAALPTLADARALAAGRSYFELYAGEEEGQLELFDLRMLKAVNRVQHPLRLPVHSVALHATGRLLSADAHQLRLSDPLSGSLLCVFESRQRLNAAVPFADSGLVLLAREMPAIGALFIPALAPAPPFCEFLEGVTEELATGADEPVFVTADELRALDGAALLDSGRARPHLHGYLIGPADFARLKQAAPRFAFDEYKARRVDAEVAERLAAQVAEPSPAAAVADVRFKRLGERDFAVDAERAVLRARRGNRKGNARK